MLGSRRGMYVTIGAGVGAIGAASAFVIVTYAGRPSVSAVSPAPNSAVASRTAPVVVSIANTDRVGDLRVELDGADVTGRVRGRDGKLVLLPRRLASGDHSVSVRFSTGNLFARTVSKSWTFAVDTTAPTVVVRTPGVGGRTNRRQVRFSGTGEPGARIRVSGGSAPVATTVRASGVWVVTPTFPDGASTARIVAADGAGNARVVSRRLVVDTIAPRIVLATNRPRIVRSATPVVAGRIVGDAAATVTFGGTVNGKPISVGGTQSANEVGAGGSALQLSEQRFRLALADVPEGESDIVIWARDTAGNRSVTRFSTIVDSTEEFGDRPLRPGARGADVRVLQKRLKEARVLKGRPTARYDARTERAVRAYQRKFKQPVTGVVDRRALRMMVGRIVVEVGSRRLRLERNGRAVMRFPVAVGMPAFPTPIGNFSVVLLQKNPTWRPPDSPWAAGLGPIPPGPGNPLGTRWIGTSSPAIGIHGTYARSSIGTAASHGCIRMYIEDVERLYEEVTLGMPVDMVA